MVKNAIVKDLLEVIDREVSRLMQKQGVALEDYLEDWEIQHIVERGLQEAIQACIDIGARIIAQNNFPKADDYHGILDILSQQKVIPRTFLKPMKEMVGLRNALVHEYRRIKHEEVHRHLQESLAIIQEFADYILKFLQKEEKE